MNLTIHIDILFYALFITLLLEGAILILFKIRTHSIWITFLLVNSITNLSMNILLKNLHPYLVWLLVLEVIIIGMEGIVYTWTMKSISKGFVISLVCNVTSLLGGYVINTLLLGGMI
ncbi:MAG: hypothetical protein WCQ80_00365 [Bacilli bacterium]